MILNAIAEKLKFESKDDFKALHFEALLIVQAVTWYLRYPLSYRYLEEMFRERGFEVDHSTIIVGFWPIPVIKKRPRHFRRPYCGSARVDETYVKIRGKCRCLYRAIDKHGNPVDFYSPQSETLMVRSTSSAKCRRMSPCCHRQRSAWTVPTPFRWQSTSVDDGHLHPNPVHYVTKYLQQGIESDHFQVKKNMPKIGGFQSFSTARGTIASFEAMLWLKKGFGFSGRLDCQRSERPARALLRTLREAPPSSMKRTFPSSPRPKSASVFSIRYRRVPQVRPR